MLPHLNQDCVSLVTWKKCNKMYQKWKSVDCSGAEPHNDFVLCNKQSRLQVQTSIFFKVFHFCLSGNRNTIAYRKACPERSSVAPAWPVQLLTYVKIFQDIKMKWFLSAVCLIVESIWRYMYRLLEDFIHQADIEAPALHCSSKISRERSETSKSGPELLELVTSVRWLIFRPSFCHVEPNDDVLRYLHYLIRDLVLDSPWRWGIQTGTVQQTIQEQSLDSFSEIVWISKRLVGSYKNLHYYLVSPSRYLDHLGADTDHNQTALSSQIVISSTEDEGLSKVNLCLSEKIVGR